MTINKFRTYLYAIAKILGDVQAVFSPKKNSIEKRIKRRILGRIAGKILGRLVK